MMKAFLERKFKSIKKLYESTDVLFLIFLILFLNVKLPLKLAALVLIYTFRFNFEFGLSLKKKSRLPQFYVLMILLCILEFFLTLNFSTPYILLFSACTCLWGVSFLVIHQIKLAIEKNGTEKIRNALEIFLALNIAVSLWNLFIIMIETRSVNPYTFEGLSYKYFISTGDNIRGITADVCTTNMIINAFGLFYFLSQRKYWFSLASLVVILMTTSNLGNIILLIFLIVVFITDSSKLNKSIMLCYISLMVVFMIKVSPSNLDYYKGLYIKMTQQDKPNTVGVTPPVKRTLNSDSLLLVFVSRKHFERKQKQVGAQGKAERENAFHEIRKKIEGYRFPVEMKDPSFDMYERNIHDKVADYCKTIYGDSLTSGDIPLLKDHKIPGKLVSFAETMNNATGSIKSFVFGEGPGNFSSKMAFRALGLNIDGTWPSAYTCYSDKFRDNHLKLWLFYRIQPPAEHSVINHPNSCANQLMGEYGLAGTLLFLVYYAGYFVRRFKFLSYGKIIFPLLLVFMGVDYWFENLSVVVIFEVMILLDLQRERTAEG